MILRVIFASIILIVVVDFSAGESNRDSIVFLFLLVLDLVGVEVGRVVGVAIRHLLLSAQLKEKYQFILLISEKLPLYFGITFF